MVDKKKCKRGEIKKAGYTTKRGVQVPPTCIKDRGAPGKGPKVIPKLKEGAMMGYSTKDKESPVWIPRTGTSIPVYLTHLSEIISVHPL